MSNDELRDTLNHQNVLLDQLVSGQAMQVARLDAVKAVVDQSQNLLQGDGGDDKPGALKRIDRLEQKARISDWVVRLIGATAIGLAINKIWSLITGKP